MARQVTSLLLLAIGVTCVSVALYRTIAIGRKRPSTLTEQRREAFACMGKPLRHRYPANPWKLRMSRRLERKRRESA